MTEIKVSKESDFWQEKFSLLIDLQGEYLIALAIAQFPFLGLPVVKQVMSYAIKKILARVEDEGELKIAFHFIDKETGEKKDEYVKSMEQYKEVLKTNPTQEQKNVAREEAKKRLATLIRYPIK